MAEETVIHVQQFRDGWLVETFDVSEGDAPDFVGRSGGHNDQFVFDVGKAQIIVWLTWQEDRVLFEATRTKLGETERQTWFAPRFPNGSIGDYCYPEHFLTGKRILNFPARNCLEPWPDPSRRIAEGIVAGRWNVYRRDVLVQVADSEGRWVVVSDENAAACLEPDPGTTSGL